MLSLKLTPRHFRLRDPRFRNDVLTENARSPLTVQPDQY